MAPLGNANARIYIIIFRGKFFVIEGGHFLMRTLRDFFWWSKEVSQSESWS